MQQLSGSAGRGGIGTPLMVRQVSSGLSNVRRSYPEPLISPNSFLARSSLVSSPDRTNVGKEEVVAFEDLGIGLASRSV